MNKNKFRFWCKGTSDNLNFAKPGWWNYGHYIFQKYYPGDAAFRCEHMTPCQFTGSADTNGREIFEGDILEESLSGEGRVRGAVVFVNSGFHVSYTWNDGKAVKLGFYLVCRRIDSRYYKAVVVGNIFENPELLEYGA